MGKLESILGGEPRYRCFTFAEEEDEEEAGEGHRYVVSRTSSEACAALGESSDSSYKIFGEAVGEFRLFVCLLILLLFFVC